MLILKGSCLAQRGHLGGNILSHRCGDDPSGWLRLNRRMGAVRSRCSADDDAVCVRRPPDAQPDCSVAADFAGLYRPATRHAPGARHGGVRQRCELPHGLARRRFGRRLILALGVACWSLATVLFAFQDSFGVCSPRRSGSRLARPGLRRSSCPDPPDLFFRRSSGTPRILSSMAARCSAQGSG